VSLIQGIDSQTFVKRLFLDPLDSGMESIENHLHFTGLEGLNKISDLDSLTSFFVLINDFLQSNPTQATFNPIKGPSNIVAEKILAFLE
jgi:hypothetical protein